MPKINLAQETMRNQVIAGRRKVVYVVSIVIIVFAAALYFGALLLTKNSEAKVAEVNQRILALQAQLRTREPAGKEIKAFSSRLVSMDTLLKNHVSWSRALGELERLVLPSVTLGSLAGGSDIREISMDVSVPNIEAAADLVVSLENTAKTNETFFTNVTATGLGSANNASVAGSAFSTKLKFSVKPEGFLNPLKP